MTHVDPLEIGSPPGFIPGRFGPGDPGFAHKKDEQCPISQIREVFAQLMDYLSLH